MSEGLVDHAALARALVTERAAPTHFQVRTDGARFDVRVDSPEAARLRALHGRAAAA